MNEYEQISADLKKRQLTMMAVMLPLLPFTPHGAIIYAPILTFSNLFLTFDISQKLKFLINHFLLHASYFAQPYFILIIILRYFISSSCLCWFKNMNPSNKIGVLRRKKQLGNKWGLFNNGNTCYFISLLQSLLAFSEIQEILRSFPFNPSQPILSQLSITFKAMESTDAAVDPYFLIEELKAINCPLFDGSHQCITQCMNYLFERLNRECNLRDLPGLSSLSFVIQFEAEKEIYSVVLL